SRSGTPDSKQRDQDVFQTLISLTPFVHYAAPVLPRARHVAVGTPDDLPGVVRPVGITGRHRGATGAHPTAAGTRSERFHAQVEALTHRAASVRLRGRPPSTGK